MPNVKTRNRHIYSMITRGSQVHVNKARKNRWHSNLITFNLLWFPVVRTGLSQGTMAGQHLHYLVLEPMDLNVFRMTASGGGVHVVLL